MKANNLIGQRFGSLTVVSKAPSSGLSRWVCFCECGNSAVVFGTNLINGRSKSCGCSKSKHNESGTKLYNLFMQKKITGMCSEWAGDYNAFKEWAISNGYTEKSQIRRIDVKKEWSPDNTVIVSNDKY